MQLNRKKKKKIDPRRRPRNPRTSRPEANQYEKGGGKLVDFAWHRGHPRTRGSSGGGEDKKRVKDGTAQRELLMLSSHRLSPTEMKNADLPRYKKGRKLAMIKRSH
jgi:hypothetical protein